MADESFDEYPVISQDQVAPPQADDFSQYPVAAAFTKVLPTSNGAYRRPEGAAAVRGIHPDVWAQVMSEEGPVPGPDGGHPSVFGLWQDAAGSIERKGYQNVMASGPNSPEAYNAVTDTWNKAFLKESEPWKLTNPGIQMLVISDSQHRGGAAAKAIIDQMGGPDVVNAMDPTLAINIYGDLRKPLWSQKQQETQPNGMPSRLQREQQWALTTGQQIGQFSQYPTVSAENVPSPSREPTEFDQYPTVQVPVTPPAINLQSEKPAAGNVPATPPPAPIAASAFGKPPSPTTGQPPIPEVSAVHSEFDQYPVVAMPAAQISMTAAKAQPEIPTGRAVSPLWPTRPSPSEQIPSRLGVSGEVTQAPPLTGEPIDIRTMQPKPELPPERLPVRDFVRQMGSSMDLFKAQANAGAARAMLNAPPSPADADAEIARLNAEAARQGLPTLTQAEMDQIRAARKGSYADQLSAAQRAEFEAQNRSPSYEYQQSIPGKVASVAGAGVEQAGAAAVAAPLGPLAVGMVGSMQAGSQAYEETYREARAGGADETKANQLADRSARVATLVGAALAASGIKIPAEDIVTRVAARAGFTGTVQAEANIIAQELHNQAFTEAGMPPIGGPEAGVAEAGATGFITGGVLGGISGALEAPNRQLQTPEARTAPETRATPETQPQPPPEQQQGSIPRIAPEKQANVLSVRTVEPERLSLLDRAIAERTPEQPPPAPPQPPMSEAISPEESQLAAKTEQIYQQNQRQAQKRPRAKPKQPKVQVPNAPQNQGQEVPQAPEQAPQPQRTWGIKYDAPNESYYVTENGRQIARFNSEKQAQDFINQQGGGTEFYAGLHIPKLTEKQKEALRYGTEQVGKKFLLQKGGEDYMLDYPETQPLGAGMRNRFDYSQEIAAKAQVPELVRNAREVTGPARQRIIDENARWRYAHERGIPSLYNPVSPETYAFMANTARSLDALGKAADAAGLMVRQADGVIRPIRLIGKPADVLVNMPDGSLQVMPIVNDYWPRMISQDMHDIFENRDGRRKADFDALVQRMIANGEIANRQEFIDRFIPATSDETSNEMVSQVEKARELKLPLEFYDYHPDVGLRYANRVTDRLAQIQAYGQRIGKAPDLFDRTVQAIEQSSRPQVEKQWMIDTVRAYQHDEYQQFARSQVQQLLTQGRQIATGFQIGNPGSAMKYLATGTFQNLTFGGPTDFVRTMMRWADPRNVIRDIKDAEDAAILRSQLRNVIMDWNPEGPTFGSNIAQLGLELGGHNAADTINRAWGMNTAKLALERFHRRYPGSTDPETQFMAQLAHQFGIDPMALANERGIGPLSDRFVRQWVSEVHGNYSYAQGPDFFHNPVWRNFFQYQQWDANAGRAGVRWFLMPFIDAVKNRDPQMTGYHAVRMLGYILGAIGSGELTKALWEVFMGRDPRDPTYAEIGTAISQGKFPQALAWAWQRSFMSIILGGMSGQAANWAQIGTSFTNPQATQAYKAPVPGFGVTPSAGIAISLFTFMQGWYGENRFLGAPSKRLRDSFAQQISAYRVGKQIATRVANVAHIPWDVAEEQAARNNLAWLRQRVQMFVQANPVYANKALQAGTRYSQSGGRTPFDPWKDDIQSALLTGNSAAAMQLTREYLKQFPPSQRPARLTALQSSVRESQPFKIGGSISATAQSDAMRWFARNFPEGEVTRIRSMVKIYARTANKTGYFSVAEP